MQPSLSSFIRTIGSVFLVLPLIAAVPAAAQVRAPGNQKPLPQSAQNAPPFQQGDGGGTGPRMLHGSFVTNPTGTPEPNNGFSVVCRPAGTGGSSFPVTTVVNSPIINGSGFLAENLFPGQFILVGDDPATPAIEGRFFQIQAVVSDTAITLTQLYFGVEGSVSAKREMLLFTTCDVSFDSAFSAPPTVVISARGNQPAPGEQFLPAAIVAQIEQGPGPVTGESFQMFLMSPGFPPHNPGGTGTVDFIAIGN